MLKYVLLAVAVFGASASALDTVQALEEARTIFTSSSGNVYLGLNDSTLLIGILGLGLLAGLLFVALQAFGADAFLPASNAYDKNSYDPYRTRGPSRFGLCPEPAPAAQPVQAQGVCRRL